MRHHVRAYITISINWEHVIADSREFLKETSVSIMLGRVSAQRYPDAVYFLALKQISGARERERERDCFPRARFFVEIGIFFRLFRADDGRRRRRRRGDD